MANVVIRFQRMTRGSAAMYGLANFSLCTEFQSEHQWAVEIRRAHPEIERIYWYGSWAHGIPTPGSDVDICLVVAGSARSGRDRAADYVPELPIRIDLLVYTRDEFERLAPESRGMYREIVRGVRYGRGQPRRSEQKAMIPSAF